MCRPSQKKRGKPPKTGHRLMHSIIEQQRQNFIRWQQGTGMSLLAIAERANLSEAGLRQYKNGKTDDMMHKNKMKLAQAFNTTVAAIFDGETGTGTALATTHPTPAGGTQPATVPVHGKLSKGSLYWSQHPTGFVEAPAGMTLSGDVFAIRMPDSSMAPRFKPREILLCDPNEAPTLGDEFVYVDMSGETPVQIVTCSGMSANGETLYGINSVAGNANAERVEASRTANSKMIARVVGLLIGH
ncbi:S24 family peptidase [Thalassospira sp.]|uniref:S24 family peptidase n=1 Tax=Thalassospira sp. TaxID=1912094 RepID=UPI000C5BAF23|nr:S24 family peptidase [Thalassospira sp.]MBC05691.1 hypothetical protein [Thalassospira sp.]|tara:strand:- start:7563 stop:8291 length:729 start_codon:yes stop_codon:yes gene_type:complete